MSCGKSLNENSIKGADNTSVSIFSKSYGIPTKQQMMPMTPREIASAVNGELHTSDCNNSSADFEECIATSVFTDSRQVRLGSIFVAIAGEHVDGHNFVSAAEKSGAVIAIVEHLVKGTNIAQIVVKNCVEALGLLAKHNLQRRRQLPTPFTIVGITGSVGKTTTKDMLNALLSTFGETVAPVGSFNNEIGLPLTALKVGSSTRFLVAEMGANHVGEIAGLTRIAPPDIAVVLKVGVAHLGEFGSVERIAQAKSEIVQGLVPNGIAVLNADDSHVRAMDALVDNSHARWFGRNTEDGLLEGAREEEYQLYASDVELDALGKPIFTLNEVNNLENSNNLDNSNNCVNKVRVHLAIQGEHNVMNALAAANVARYLGMDLSDIAEGLRKVSRISPHRMQLSLVSHDHKNFILIDDSFNANPDSVKAGIDGLCAYERNDKSQPSSLFRIAVLGSMLELGKNECELHSSVGEYAACASVDAIIAVGSKTDEKLDNLASWIYKGARNAWGNKSVEVDEAVHWVHSVEEADAIVWKLVADHPSSVVLLKGSHASGLSVLADRWAKI